MICVSINETTREKCVKALEGIEFAEIRLDRMNIEVEDVRNIFSQHPQLIATCRPSIMDDGKRKALLIAAVEAGASFVDIEVESDKKFKNTIIEKARNAGCRIIISYHNFKKTPKNTYLDHIIKLCFESGADVAKVACMVNSKEDNATLLGLLQGNRPLIVVGMGEKGIICRIAAPFLGSLFTYASQSIGKETAPGQLNIENLKSIIETIKNV